jgi:hypothetical protein
VIAMVSSPMVATVAVAVEAMAGIGEIITLAPLPPADPPDQRWDWREPVVDALSPGPGAGRPGQTAGIGRR